MAGRARPHPYPAGPKTAWELRQTAPHVVEAIDQLLDHHTHAEIAAILNARGHTSGEGRPFHRLIVRNIRDEYGLRSRQQRLRDAGMLTLDEMADRLGVSAGTVKAWRHAGLVSGQCYNDKRPGALPPTRAEPTGPAPRTTPALRPATCTNIRHPRTDPKGCSVKPKVSLSAPAVGW